MGPRFGAPPPFKEAPKRQKPKNAKEFFSMLGKTVKSFFSHLFYIIGLVWETNPAILLLMVFFCVCNGFLPVIGAYISKDLLNAVSEVLHLGEAGEAIAGATLAFRSFYKGSSARRFSYSFFTSSISLSVR